MAVQISTTGNEKVVLETFTRINEIPRTEKCQDLPVMIRVKAASGFDQERWCPSLDLVVMINYDPRRSMLSTTPGHVKRGLLSMIDQLGPRDRLCFLKGSMTSLTEMSETGRSIAKRWVKDMHTSTFGKNAVEKASEILKSPGTNESNNRVGCIILIAHGRCELQDTTGIIHPIHLNLSAKIGRLFSSLQQISMSQGLIRSTTKPANGPIDFPVHIFGLSDIADIILENIKEKVSITCYNLKAGNFNDMIMQLISELKSVITRRIQINMKAHKGVIISSIESGGYKNRINAEEGTGMIEIDYVCGGEEKNFIVHLVVSEGVMELMTVDGKGNDNNGEIQLNQTCVCVQRPERSVKNICSHVAAEIIRLELLKSVSNLTHGHVWAIKKKLKKSWSQIRESEDGKVGREYYYEDIALIASDSKYRNLWLAHQKWQRASTKALLSSRYAWLYVYTPWMNEQHI